jgi:hypothetical protein
VYRLARYYLPAAKQQIQHRVEVVSEMAAMSERQIVDKTGDVRDREVVVRLRVISSDVVGVLR